MQKDAKVYKSMQANEKVGKVEKNVRNLAKYANIYTSTQKYARLGKSIRYSENAIV